MLVYAKDKPGGRHGTMGAAGGPNKMMDPKHNDVGRKGCWHGLLTQNSEEADKMGDIRMSLH